jgi:hypothetical protein
LRNTLGTIYLDQGLVGAKRDLWRPEGSRHFENYVLGFRVFRVKVLGFRVQGLGFRV